ncbi:MAG: protein kinase [Planctomycetota bacterium]|nr:protein kinase [Planctomycetota bacterium]
MIGGRISVYEILSELGSGGMGSVYLARCAEEAAGLDEGVQVALKVIHPNLLSQPGFFKRFLREAQIGQNVQHENVVRTYDCDATLVDGQQHNFLVMEYVEGQTLRDLLGELERVPEELCRHIGREVARGLTAIHEAGVVHRDIKPENVLITQEHVVKVMDLGVARLQDEAIRLSQAGAFVGSLEYAAPEQFRSADGDPDGRADLHSLGVVLYELATGQHPYRDEEVSKVMRNILDEEPRKAGEVNPQLSPFFEEVVGTLVAKDRDDRFADAAALAAVLEEGERGEWWRARAKALRIETKRPLRRIRVPRETALYGRDDDLAKLRALYDKAKAGDGQVLLIEGEAGIGKTRLVDEFVGRLRQESADINFLFGSYPPGGAATASGAFSEAYREQFGDEGSAPWLSQTPILVSAFDALLRGEPAPKDAEALTKESLGTVFVHATRSLAAERPTIVLIDDLHFAPEDARSLFMTLALAVPEHPILLIGTMRSGVDETWVSNVTRLDHASLASLPRLGPKDLSALLRDAFRSERLADELGWRIAQKSDGNPFFAFEIIRGLREGQFITQQPDGTWVSTRVIQDIQIPASVLDLVKARTSDLTQEQRDLLDVAACCGFEFDPGLLAAVVDQGRIPVLKSLAQIERAHRLVRSRGRNFAFDHHQVQEAIYDSLPEMLREEYHAAIADALEKREKAAEEDLSRLRGALCVDLCEHFLKGAHGERAVRYLHAALSHLEAGHLKDQTIALADLALRAERLLDGQTRVRVLLSKANNESALGRFDDALAGAEEAMAVADELGEDLPRIRARACAGHQLLGVGRDLDRAGRLFEEAARLARESGNPADEARLIGWSGHVHWHWGRLDRAEECYLRRLRWAQETGQREDMAGALIDLGNIHSMRGQMRDAMLAYEEGLASAREAGHGYRTGIAEMNLGSILLRVGRHEMAARHLESAQAVFAEIGYQRYEPSIHFVLGQVVEQAGNEDEALSRYEAGTRMMRMRGSRVGEAALLLELGRVTGQRGDRERARRLFDRAESIGRDSDTPNIWLLAGACCAAFFDTSVDKLVLELNEFKSRCSHMERLQIRYWLWRATKLPAHLDEAKRLLDYLVEHAPHEHRESMLTNVQLNREIMEAWNERMGS